MDKSRLKVTALENNKHSIDKVIIIEQKKNFFLFLCNLKDLLSDLTRRENRILIFNA